MKTKWLIGLFVLGALFLMFVGFFHRMGKEHAADQDETVSSEVTHLKIGKITLQAADGKQQVLTEGFEIDGKMGDMPKVIKTILSDDFEKLSQEKGARNVIEEAVGVTPNSAQKGRTPLMANVLKRIGDIRIQKKLDGSTISCTIKDLESEVKGMGINEEKINSFAEEIKALAALE